MQQRHPYRDTTPAAQALNVAGQKWTLLIVRELLDGPKRPVQIQRDLGHISNEQLRACLTNMCADGLASKTRYRESPPRVDYELTEKGRDLAGVLDAYHVWGAKWIAPEETKAA